MIVRSTPLLAAALACLAAPALAQDEAAAPAREAEAAPADAPAPAAVGAKAATGAGAAGAHHRGCSRRARGKARSGTPLGCLCQSRRRAYGRTGQCYESEISHRRVPFERRADSSPRADGFILS
jgi:hypothetical protein